MANSSFNNILLVNDTSYVVLTIDGVEYRLRKSPADSNPDPITKQGSFLVFTLENNILTVDNVSFILNSTSTATSSELNSFKIINAVNNGDDTISLTVNGNTIVVSGSGGSTTSNFILYGGGHLITEEGDVFKVVEETPEFTSLALANGDLLVTTEGEVLQIQQ